MRLTMKERQSVIAVMQERYGKAGKKLKRQILDECCRLTGYNRAYASHLLCHYKRARKRKEKAQNQSADKKRVTPYYDGKVKQALVIIWMIMDCICGKRLQPFLSEIIPILEKHREIKLAREVREKLLKVSSATIDRLLAEEKKKLAAGSRSHTKPGTLLKSQIPIRTFSEWDDARPGFVEIDLVAHDGGDAQGEYLYTLDVTDVCTGWTETMAVRNKSQVAVFDALLAIRQRLPFDLLGIDSDNGSEFINNQLLRYCLQEKITFTRTRNYRKNDNCFVEQKNYSVVRRNVGYLRHETQQELELLNELYRHLRLYTNFFQPVMKLRSKERDGARVRKKYDLAQTPYRRALASTLVEKKNKVRLKGVYQNLNPAHLKREITRLQNQLLDLASKRNATRQELTSIAAKETPGQQTARKTPSANHPWRRTWRNKSIS
jgi:hypothetical protein